jgi:hypothetical protein
MDRTGISKPRVSAALFFAGLWLRVGVAAAFAGLAAPLLVVQGAMRPGDGLALLLLGAALAWLAWRRTRALLGDEPVEVASPSSLPRRRATAA